MAVDALPHRKQELEGEVPLGKLVRLRGAVGNDAEAGVITAAFYLDIDTAGRRWLVYRIRTCLELQCQRCLESMSWTPKLQGRWLIQGGDARDDGEHDLLPAEQGMLDLWQAIEDELLLALPMVPRHEPACPGGQDRIGSGTLQNESDVSTGTRRPFAGLDKLMNGKSQG